LEADQQYRKVIFSHSNTKRAYTFQDIRSLSIQFGKGLREREQLQTGDVVALFSPNDVDYPVVIWGTHWAGCTASLINPSYTASELEFQLLDSNAKVLVTHRNLLPTVLKVVEKIKFPRKRICLLGDENETRGLGFKHFKSLASHNALPRPAIDPRNNLSFLIYSSGTTGKPKGVMLTHTNIVSNILMIAACHNGNLTWNGGPSGAGDSIIGFLPFFHSYGEFLERSQPQLSREPSL
jgi:4-coumarate--CoA ligase